MQKAVAEAGGERDYYKLYLPDGLDTLPAMVLAGKALFADPAAFGYRAAQARPWPPLSGRRAVTAAPAPLRDLAAQYTADYKHFRDLNPHLTGDMVPAGVGVNLP